MPDCIFCDIMGGRGDAAFLYQDEDTVVFLDKYPIDYGHSLVVPRRHYERITDMSSSDVGAMFAKIPRIAQAVLAGTGADAFSLAQNNGRAAKQVVLHVHVHIIPRFSHKETNWARRGMPDVASQRELADRIRAHL